MSVYTASKAYSKELEMNTNCWRTFWKNGVLIVCDIKFIF